MQIFLKNKFIFLFLYFFSFSYCYGKWQVFREHKTFTEYFEMESDVRTLVVGGRIIGSAERIRQIENTALKKLKSLMVDFA